MFLSDSRTLLFTTLTLDTHRPNRVWRYNVAAQPTVAGRHKSRVHQPSLVFEEGDERFHLSLWRSRSGTLGTLPPLGRAGSVQAWGRWLCVHWGTCAQVQGACVCVGPRLPLPSRTACCLPHHAASASPRLACALTPRLLPHSTHAPCRGRNFPARQLRDHPLPAVPACQWGGTWHRRQLHSAGACGECGRWQGMLDRGYTCSQSRFHLMPLLLSPSWSPCCARCASTPFRCKTSASWWATGCPPAAAAAAMATAARAAAKALAVVAAAALRSPTAATAARRPTAAAAAATAPVRAAAVKAGAAAAAVAPRWPTCMP